MTGEADDEALELLSECCCVLEDCADEAETELVLSDALPDVSAAPFSLSVDCSSLSLSETLSGFCELSVSDVS